MLALTRPSQARRYILVILIFLVIYLLKYPTLPLLPSSMTDRISKSLSASTGAMREDVLIVVACHAIYMGGHTNGRNEAEWLIEPFQVGETPTFVEHIRRGVEELSQSTGSSVLAFSGGATKKLKTKGIVRKTEAEGYAVRFPISLTLHRLLHQWQDTVVRQPGVQRSLRPP